MATIRGIRRKIRAIGKIDDICSAMKTVAQIKLVRAEARIREARLYSERMRQMAAGMAAMVPDSPFVSPRAEGKLGLIVITSDKGLCGSYNMNVIREAEALAREAGEVSLVCFGRKGTQYFRRRDHRIEFSVVPQPGEGGFAETAAIADRIMELYQEGVWGSARLVYTYFLSLAHCEAVSRDYLPVKAVNAEEFRLEEMLFEPAPQQLAAYMLPRYLRSILHYAILEATASEQAVRVTAMTSATHNAEDMMRQLNLDYNRARQAGITEELIDIVGSAEALIGA